LSQLQSTRGISGGERRSIFEYDGRSRLASALIGAKATLTPSSEKLSKSDFRKAVERTPATPRNLESQTATEHASKGHKLGTLTRDGKTIEYAYQGGERTEDDRFLYRWDEKSRLMSVTEKPLVPGSTIRRIRYFWDGNDRLVGRSAQMAAAILPDLEALAWTAETRPAILDSDGLPAETTFAWDPISDRLLAIWRAGASQGPLGDGEGGLLRQIIHGEQSYDDPLEVTAVASSLFAFNAAKDLAASNSAEASPPSPVILSAAKDPHPEAEGGGVIRLFPVFDEAGAGSLQAIFGADGRLRARHFAEDPYGDGESMLLGGAIESVELEAKKDAAGNLSELAVRMRATEGVVAATVGSGARLAVVNEAGGVVGSFAQPGQLMDANTIRWTLTGGEWAALAGTPGAAALSIAATKSLRFTGWGDAGPMAAPSWSTTALPVYTTAEVPVEVRASLTTLSTWVGTIVTNASETRTLLDLPSLPALGSQTESGSAGAKLQQLITSAAFHAYPFSDSATGLIYARARWFHPFTGTFLTPDPMGYRDSSNLYAFAGGDPVNGRDPTGMATDPLTKEEREQAQAKAAALNAQCRSDRLSAACLGLTGALFGDRKAETIRVNGRRFPGKSPVVFINGITNEREEAIATAAKISDRLGVPVDLIWNPTQNFLADIAQTVFVNKAGKPDATTVETVNYLRKRLAADPNGNITVLSHSQGGSIFSTAAGLLTRDERARIDGVTWAAAAYTQPTDLGSLRNIINVLDPVPLLAGKTLSFEKENEYTFFLNWPFNHPAQSYLDAQLFLDWLETPAGEAWREQQRRQMVERNWSRR
jgi:RHS repeat-associated protein